MFDDLDKLDKLQKQAQKSEPVDNGKRGINLLPTDLRRSEKSYRITSMSYHYQARTILPAVITEAHNLGICKSLVL